MTSRGNMEFGDNNNVALVHKQSKFKLETSDYTVKAKNNTEISERLAPTIFCNDSNDIKVREKSGSKNRKGDFYR